MSGSTTSSPSFDEHCRELGRLCLAWAELNRNITNLTSVLIGRGPEVTACLFPGSENMKPRCESVKKLVALNPPGSDEAWRDGLTSLMNHVLGDLTVRRNRYVHDEWFGGPDGIVRFDATTRLEKGQSRQKRGISFGRWYPDESAKVENLTAELRQLTDQLALTVIVLVEHECAEQPLGPFPPQP